MKSKCSFILKASTALVLALLMLFGSITTVIGATAGTAKGDSALTLTAKKVVDIAETGAKVDLAETGAISNITAQVSGKSAHSSSSFPLEFTESLTKDSWYGIRINFYENGDHYCKASDNNNIAIGTAKELGWGNGNSSDNSGMSWFQATKTGNFSFSIYTSGGKNYVKIEEAKNPLTTPTISIDGKTSGVTVASGSTAAVKITNWSAFSGSITGGYCTLALYKGDTKIGNNITAETTIFTFTESGDYYVKCEPTASTEATYTASSSSTVDVTVTLTIYVKNAADWSNIYYYVYTSDSSHGTNWPGTKITSTAIGTIGGKNVYKVENVPQYSYIILNVGSNSSQYPNNVALANGKLYPTGTTAPTVVDYSSSLLDKPKYDVTFTPSPTGGTVKVDGNSTSPAKVSENEDFTILAKPNTGYTIDTVKVGTTTLTAQSGGSDSAGYTYTYNVGKAAKTVTATFKKVNYTVTLNKNADSATAGTASVTAKYGEAMPTATMPTRTGYTFAGYYDTSAANGGTQYYTAAGASARTWNKTANTTLYARWTAVTGAVKAAAYTSGAVSTTGGTVFPASLTSVTIDSTDKKITATKKTNYSFTGWQISGTKATNLYYRFGTSDTWTKVASNGETVGTASNTTIYIKTDGSSGITTSTAEVRALFVETDYTGLTVGAAYTLNNDTYTDFSPTPSGVTIAADHGTYQTGVAVTAPVIDGYQFYMWYSAKGTFDNANSIDTTFKPNSADAKAIARYKKIHNISISVDPSGTGAGTASTSVATVLAGGSYDITATAKNGSGVESVKVNGTAKTATASQTISSVSADQTVVVKFKSNVYLKGTMNADAWAGDVMTANTAGDTYTIANVVLNAGTTYEFKHWVDSGGNGTYSITVGTWTLNNIATHSTKDDGYGGTNLTITPSVKAKVTFVSDGTKFTSITAIPYNSTTYNVTLTQSADYTITSTYMGVEYTTAGKNANVTVPVYSGTGFSYTVTPASGKYLSAVAQSDSVALSPAFSATTHANSYPGTVSSVSKAFAVSATAANKLSVAAKTNKSARGTVSVSPMSAAPGETITITVSPKNGVLKTLTATYGNGAVYTCNLTTKVWTKNSTTNSAGSSTSMAAPKLDIAAIGANIALVAVGADTTYTMNLAENSTVTINATFDAYSAESSYYYYGYDDSGNAISAYNGKQMTEGMISGEKFSYYQVSGRTENDQRFKVATKATGTRRFYVETPNTTDWNGNNNMRNPYIYWFDSEWGTFEKLTYDEVHGNKDGKKWWYTTNIHEGVGCLIVNMNNTSDGGFKQTADISADDVAYGAVWISSSMSNNKYTIGGRFTENDRPGDAGSGVTYYSWGDSVYATGSDNAAPYSFGTSGFNDHDQNYAKPKGDGYKSGSYYVVVLYPNTTYTINGVTKTTGNKIDVIWMTDLPGDETVTVYAKDGAIRSETYGSTYANIADTKIYVGNDTVGTKHNGNITNQTYETYKPAKGDTIVIKTQIGATDSSTLSNAAALKAKYYVRGFCVNGEVSELLEWNADGLYTLTYKVPEDIEDGAKIEITPIYYLKDTTANPIVTYRVTGFTDELKAVGSGKPNWGDTLYTYPFYGKLGSNNNALGAYPGQPMVYYKGQYQMQIPQKSTAWDIYYDDGALSGYSGNTAKENAVANTSVSGVTMSNGYYDLVHRQVQGYGSNGASADHVQTYDYGDFYKIFNEKKPVDNIVFDFKYETKKHNFENQPAATTTKSELDTNYGTNGNGFELLTNFHGRTVDLFGTPLSGTAADPEQTTPVYVVSIGGVNGSAGVENIAGYYATEWMVYGSSDGTNYSRITATNPNKTSQTMNSIPPEVLVLNDDDTTSFNATTYPSADANHTITNWQNLYHALEAYRGKPVMISYEAADAQIGAGNYATSGGGGATRNDGRWLYSKNGENITSRIKIQYSTDNGDNYTDLDTTSPQVTGLSAYFTNDGVEGQMTYSTTIDPDKTFDFEAKTTNGEYKFVGWYMEDGTKITSDNASHTERSGSYTFVAKFMQVQGGQLILSHSADKGTIGGTDYQGAGTAKISAVVKDGEEVVRTYDLSTSDITLDDKIIKSDSTYTIDVTLEATATGNDMLGTTVLANPSGQDSTYFNAASTTTVEKTKTIVLNSFTVASLFSGTTQNVKNIIYHSYFTEAVFNYNLKFEYTDRFGNAKTFYRIGKLTAAQAANPEYVAVESDGDHHNRFLLPAFYSKLAPHESNFGKDFQWEMTARLPFTQQNNIYTCNNYIRSTQTDNNLCTATFNLPYVHTNGVPSNYDVMTKEESENFVIENIAYGDIVKGTDYVIAPKTLNDSGTIKNFQYWSMASTKSPNAEVARCYFYSFNFVAYDNYIITPIYAESPTPLGDGNSAPLTTVSFLKTTRNQFTGDGTDTAPLSGKAKDILFNDFVLSYEYQGKEIYKNDSSSSDVSQIGYVVERVQKLEVKQDGTPYTDASHYSEKEVSVKTEQEIKDFVSANTSSDVKSSGTLTKYTLAKDALDNKNRIEFYEAYTNAKGWNTETQKFSQTSGYKNYVFKAYSYMIVNGEVFISSSPAYFTMYDEAVK